MHLRVCVFLRSCGIEAEECWQLVQSFSLCHQLPPSVAFITVCADQGQWLPLLCHAQLHNITARKVIIVDTNLLLVTELVFIQLRYFSTPVQGRVLYSPYPTCMQFHIL